MSGPAMIQDLPVAGVDILGAEDGRQTIFANAMLAELVTRMVEDDPAAADASSTVEYDQLLELAAPAGDLLRVVHKLAAAVRLGEWCLERDAGTYDAALARLLASILADVIALRQAELRRRELLARPAGRGPVAVAPVLDGVRDPHRAKADLLGELVERVKKLEGGKAQAEAAA